MYSGIELGDKFNRCEYDTLLDALKSMRVFTIKKKDDIFEIWDGCDDYFSAKLSRENFEKLIEEMKALL